MTMSDKLKSVNRDFLSGEAGRLSDLATRTISSWCERGLLLVPTAGRGDRRRFNALQLVEIAIISELSKSGVPQLTIKEVMEFIRRELEYGLTLESFHLVIHSESLEGQANRAWVFNWKAEKDKGGLLQNVFGSHSERVQIFNLSVIAKKVLDRL